MHPAGRLHRVVTIAVAVAAVATPASASAADVYVALGDSYTAGPLIPEPTGEPIDCGRSTHNYPTLVAGEIKPTEFIDVSCGSAKTNHMTEPQGDLPLGGTNPPQFNALRPGVGLVTVGIGGNDMGFGGIVEKCAELGIQSLGQGSPCTDHYNAGGVDTIAQRLRDVVFPRLAEVITGIQRRSPDARLLVVGYPDPVPQPPGCYPEVPIAPGDLPYLHRVAEGLSATVREAALDGGAEYVHLLGGSIGHDICQPPGTRWYEGIVPTSPAYPAHPNRLGMEFAAREVLGILGKPVPNDFEIVAKRGARRGGIRLELRAPFRGEFEITATAKRRRRDRDGTNGARPGKRFVYATADAFAHRARRLTIRLRPTKKGRRALRNAGRLRVALEISFDPVGGAASAKGTRVRVGRRR